LNVGTALKAGIVQLVLVAILAVLLAVLLPGSFFEDWGWLSGPAALLLCAYATARILGLPVSRTLAGVIVSGIPALIAVVIGVHWLGTLIAVIGFAVWCGMGPAPKRA
jgi:hypothetical protein